MEQQAEGPGAGSNAGIQGLAHALGVTFPKSDQYQAKARKAKGIKPKYN